MNRTQTTSLLSLPNDLLLNCIARVSRLYYPTLSFVSKRFRSLLTSPELYKTRSLLGHTESCLYVCLNIWFRSRWFTLCRKPNQTLTSKKKKSSGYVLARVPIPDYPHTHVRSLVAVGSDIYNVCDSIFYAPCSSVTILDCQTHTWRMGPSLRVQLNSFTTSLVDEKIYVGGSSDFDGDSFEVLDTKTQIWDHVPVPTKEKSSYYYHSACIDGKFHVQIDGDMIAYNAKERTWDLVEEENPILEDSSYCEIENVLYSAFEGRLSWYDTEERTWRELKGLVGLPKLPKFPSRCCVRLADYGGKMAVLWEDDLLGGPGCRYDEKRIWCAVIKVYKLNDGEIYGEVEWFDEVLTVFDACELVKALVVTV